MADESVDVCVVGAGAAGLTAAYFATAMASGSGSPRIAVLDSAKTIGAKILISGGGRCNVTHHVVTPTDFFGNRRIIKNVLAAFPVEQTIRWFASLGVQLKQEETGKLFPTDDKAKSVLNALLDGCRKQGIIIHPDHRVTDIARADDPAAGFVVRHGHGTIMAKAVVVATGGRSVPKSGSDGFGYTLISRLGHRVTPTLPALVPFILKKPMFHEKLSGLSQDVTLTTVVKGRTVDERTGSMLWTHIGISGPVVMDASRFWTLAQTDKDPVDLYANFFPGENISELRRWFQEQRQAYPRRSLMNTLATRLPQRFAEAVIRHAGCDATIAIGQLPRADRERLLDILTRFRFAIDRDRGWNHAEVTAGGVPLEEINFRTMESKLIPGLYLVGEILDCDGRIGGFNFQWAWATGYLAGRSLAAGFPTRSSASATDAMRSSRAE